MATSERHLKTLLAHGNLEPALEMLVRLTERTDDADLRQRVLTLSGQFAQLKKQHLTGLLEDKDYRLQWNRISTAVAEIAESGAVTASHRPTHRTKWAVILFLLAIIAAAAGYYWLRNRQPAPAQYTPAEPRQKDTVVAVLPSAKNTPPDKAASSKNNVKIEVKDKAKVGNIITGDSNKIDIKQDFGQ